MEKKALKKVKAVGRPKSTTKNHLSASSAEKGTAPGFMRKSYLANIEAAGKLDAIAYWERKTIKEVLHDAMKEYIRIYEEEKGEIKQPVKQKK